MSLLTIRSNMKKQKGFSLIEMLVYMGIFSILLITLMQFFGSILDVKLESEATSSVTQDGRFIISRLSYDIHRTSTLPTPGTQDTSLTLSIDSTNYTYSLNGDNLEIKNNATNETNQLNSADTTVSNLSFKTLGVLGGTNNTVQVSFRLKSKVIKTGGNNQTEVFQTTIGKRI